MGVVEGKIRVLVVDDSALMSRQITGILTEDPEMEVIGRAKDGVEALEMVSALKPDVITMDVEMPRMNGITALKHIMVKHGIPTVMISALTKEGARASFDAFKYGAVDVIAKPSRREDENLDAQKADIVSKVRRAAAIRTGRSKYLRVAAENPGPKQSKGEPNVGTRYIGIGAGTGGYYSLLRIVPSLPVDFEEVLVVVVLTAAKYIDPFVNYLDAHSLIPVKNGADSSVLERGVCYICSSEAGLRLDLNGSGVLKFLDLPASVQGMGPVNALLGSLAEIAGPQSVGIVLSGAGADGADGLTEIRKHGGSCVVQDINTCMDPSMPLAALQRGSVDRILSDEDIAEYLMQLT
jgi:two-component system chemotaxis response regulator CheB